MANPEHLKILKQGVAAWNQWLRLNQNITPDLSSAELSGLDFSGANFFTADFSRADLVGVKFANATLNEADFTGARLTGADFSYVRLCETVFDNANLEECKFYHSLLMVPKFKQANLKKARLAHSVFWAPNFSDSNMTGAFFESDYFYLANFSHVNLLQAHLSAVYFHKADFSRANLVKARLTGTVFSNSIFGEDADMTGAAVGHTIFSNLNLSEVKGLKTVIHYGPSTIGIDTIYSSTGRIPDAFLRDAGVPEEIIDIARSIRNGPPIQWHSCFISHSSKDEEFAKRLHARMRTANMRVWFAPEDLKGGKKLHEQLFEAIQIHDRLLIVLSEHSIQSEWVLTEIRKARETEKKEKRRKLFPIRLCDFETLNDWTCIDTKTGVDLAEEVRSYFIPDFSKWKVLADGHHAAFESAFSRLKKDLEAENSKKP